MNVYYFFFTQAKKTCITILFGAFVFIAKGKIEERSILYPKLFKATLKDKGKCILNLKILLNFFDVWFFDQFKKINIFI